MEVPSHLTTRAIENGLEFDALWDGYVKIGKDGKLIGDIGKDDANKMLKILNDPEYGSRVEKIYVDYQRKDGDPFYDAIKNVVLDDGIRLATQVIRPDKGHDDHFHINLVEPEEWGLIA